MAIVTQMSKITRTIYGARIQNMQFSGLPYSHVPFTTLNEKYNIHPGVTPDNGEVPVVRYYCIGNRGHENRTGADGQPLTVPRKHDPADAALYRQLPFVLRKPSDDLSSVERMKYGLRKFETIDGEVYAAYYLKRIDMSAVAPNMMTNMTANNITTSLPFVPTGSNLNPVPTIIPPGQALIPSGTTLSSSSILSLGFTEADVSEFMDAVNILFKDPYYGVVSEIGLVAGADKIVPFLNPDGSTSGQFNEVVSATITTHICDYYPVSFANKGFDFNLNIGAAEPLFHLAPIP